MSGEFRARPICQSRGGDSLTFFSISQNKKERKTASEFRAPCDSYPADAIGYPNNTSFHAHQLIRTLSLNRRMGFWRSISLTNMVAASNIYTNECQSFQANLSGRLSLLRAVFKGEGSENGTYFVEKHLFFWVRFGSGHATRVCNFWRERLSRDRWPVEATESRGNN